MKKVIILLMVVCSVLVNTAFAQTTISFTPDKLFTAFDSFYKGLYPKAFQLFKELADNGCEQAYFGLGVCYYHGRGVTKDYKQAEYYYKMGNATASYHLFSAFISYYDGPYPKAFQLFKELADNGCEQAYLGLAVCYFNGRGVTKDYKQAVYYLSRAYKMGNATAGYHLGRCYMNGYGVEKNLSTAITYLEKAVSADVTEAKTLLTQAQAAYEANLPQILNDEMVTVEGGTFQMGATPEQGSDALADEKPVHSVTLGTYQIGKYEVTQRLWKAVMGSNPSNVRGDDLPVEQVSWNDVQEFLQKLNQMTGRNYRLPTEAEWEYAARGGNKSRGYKYSGSNNIDEVACYLYSSEMTHAVGTKSPNELGIYDMTGNVWEWCQDCYGPYSEGSQSNPSGPSSGSYRVYRGGSHLHGAWSCRVSIRKFDKPVYRSVDRGFRLAL